MTTQTLEQQIATLRRVLADATKECPIPEPFPHPKGCKGECGGVVVPRFPGFRQVCPHCPYTAETCHLAHSHIGEGLAVDDCRKCNGTGWQVAPGGLEDALAGLSRREAKLVIDRMAIWVLAEILAKALELVIEIAGLSVAHSVGDSCHGGLGHATVGEKLNDTDHD